MTVYDWEPIDALARLLVLTDDEREIWVDSKIVRVPLDQLAEREGVTKQAIWLRLVNIEKKIAGTATAASYRRSKNRLAATQGAKP